ncbi:MAG: hypothetical protein NTW30_02425 [Candidatus Aenigmarchaeota archaeon]|nr:hypothetical protein [Candidatus Aenigmarchaeota archaeon]
MNMEDVKRINEEKGQYYFTESTMRFFNSKVESELIEDKYFITSEQFDEKAPRLFTVREFNKESGWIRTIGKFQEFKDRFQAEDFAYCMIEKDDVEICREELKKIYG